MPLGDFLLHSRSQRNLLVGHPASERIAADSYLAPLITMLDSDARLDCPGLPPPLNMAVALWAARQLYALSQALAFRELAGDFIANVMAIPCPAKQSPAACYSADLVFRLLPDLARLAGAISQDDPLTLAIVRLGGEWPLSSVGMRGVEPENVAEFFDHPSLRRLYIDRILGTGDTGRLKDANVAAAVADVLGAHRSMAPSIALALTVPT